VSVQDRCTICAKHNIASEIILDAPDSTPRSRGSWKLNSVHLEMVLILMQDRCTVWAKHHVATEIILDAPDGTRRFEAQEEAQFCPFGDYANLDTT
jgi:hypothetical protein